MDRPAILRRCLESIAKGSRLPTEVIVSDDNPSGGQTREVCQQFSFVRYVQGPSKGLCANRNRVIAQAVTDYVSLLDDDAMVGEDFVVRAMAATADLPPNEILTGAVIESENRLVAPANSTFLGHFGRPPTGRYKNINLNCNLFPRAAFAYASFDEQIAYGYEDMDLCSCLLACGFRIRYDPTLVNAHLPPEKAGATQRRQSLDRERARFYTSVKRYLLWERAPMKLLLFLVAAPIHRAAHAIKARLWYDVPHCLPDIAFAVRMTCREAARLKRSARR